MATMRPRGKHWREAAMADTVFGKIVRGEIPCHKVYEDDKVLAFLDINPLSHGHTLVVPKEPAETLDRLSEESAAALGRVLPQLCRAIVAVTGIKEYNVLENNGTGAHQAIAHVHFHIIPKPNGREGLGIGWPLTTLDPKAGAALAAKIAGALSRNRARLPAGRRKSLMWRGLPPLLPLPPPACRMRALLVRGG